jgi:hypothetical protein
MWPCGFLPGGTTFPSAFWWPRLGGLILRIFHHLIWLSHAGFLYVDDFLFYGGQHGAFVGNIVLYFLPATEHFNQLEEDCHAFFN